MNSLGSEFERLAAERVLAEGLILVAQNFQAKTGEIDLVALDNLNSPGPVDAVSAASGKQLVFIEVRARRNPRFASAAATVDKRKQARLIRTAHYFLQTQRQYTNLPCRFDVITFEPRQSPNDYHLSWIRSAFTA